MPAAPCAATPPGALPQDETSVDFLPGAGLSGADLVAGGANDFRGFFGALGDSATGYYVHRNGADANPCSPDFEGGLPAITDTLTIDGRGATVERSYASGTTDFSIFTVNAVGGDLNLNNVNVRHGGGDTDYYGGAINSSGAVAIDGGTFSNSDGGEYGGAIFNDGSLTVRNAAFHHLQVAGGDHLGVDEVLDRAAGQIPYVIARKNHGLNFRIPHHAPPCTPFQLAGDVSV